VDIAHGKVGDLRWRFGTNTLLGSVGLHLGTFWAGKSARSLSIGWPALVLCWEKVRALYY